MFLFNKNKKIEQHLIEIKFMFLFIFFILSLNFVLLLTKGKNNNLKKYSNSKYKKINCEEEDLVNKIVYLYNGKKKPCLKIKYDLREENINLNHFQKNKLSEQDLKLLINNNAKVILYKDITGKILGISCPKFTIYNDKITIFMNDFTGDNLDKLLSYKNNQNDSLFCPPIIKR